MRCSNTSAPLYIHRKQTHTKCILILERFFFTGLVYLSQFHKPKLFSTALTAKSSGKAFSVRPEQLPWLRHDGNQVQNNQRLLGVTSPTGAESLRNYCSPELAPKTVSKTYDTRRRGKSCSCAHNMFYPQLHVHLASSLLIGSY